MASVQSRPKERNYGLQSLGNYVFMEKQNWHLNLHASDSPRHIDSVYKTQQSVGAYRDVSDHFCLRKRVGIAVSRTTAFGKMMQRVHHPLTRGSSSSVWTAPGLHAHWPVGFRGGHSLAASVSDLLDMSSFGFVLSTPRITKSLLRSFTCNFLPSLLDVP